MTIRRTIFAAAVLLGIVAVSYWWCGRGPSSAPAVSRPTASAPSRIASLPAANAAPMDRSAPVGELSGVSHLADDLNGPGGTIRRDLEILNEVFVTWQTNFPRDGNPVGENPEITAALIGGNSVRFGFIPPGHRAINSRGELCDRWDTPFRFHQLSGRQMEIRSAGPDRQFGTRDDASFSPAAPFPVPR